MLLPQPSESFTLCRPHTAAATPEVARLESSLEAQFIVDLAGVVLQMPWCNGGMCCLRQHHHDTPTPCISKMLESHCQPQTLHWRAAQVALSQPARYLVLPVQKIDTSADKPHNPCTTVEACCGDVTYAQVKHAYRMHVLPVRDRLRLIGAHAMHGTMRHMHSMLGAIRKLAQGHNHRGKMVTADGVFGCL